MQIPQLDGVNAPTHRVLAKGQIAVVKTDTFAANRKIAVRLGHLGYVEDDFLWGVLSAFFAGVKRVFGAFFKTVLVPIAIFKIGHRLVVLLEASHHFGVKGFPKIFRIGHNRLGIGIFGVEVGQHFGILALLEPKIIVDALVAVGDQYFGIALRNGSAGIACLHEVKCLVWAVKIRYGNGCGEN